MDNGVKADDLGTLFTKNPHLLDENLDDMEVRVEYLASKNFSPEAIASILTKNPYWLCFSTVRIDRRLGFFQRLFQLTGSETREVAMKYPKIVTGNLWRVKVSFYYFFQFF